MFHAAGGYFFERGEDGSVHILVSTPDGAKNISSIILDRDTWCSAVAAVSVYGDTTEAWHRAVELHEGYEKDGTRK